jgi:hypothetical protein
MMKNSGSMLAIVACATIAIDARTYGQSSGASNPVELERKLAELKAKTATLIESDRARLDAMSRDERLAAPTVIWRVPDAITEFRDCVECPQMIVIPAGEFTMGSPPSEQNAEAQHRVTIASPFAVGKFEISFEEWDACVAEVPLLPPIAAVAGWLLASQGRGRDFLILSTIGSSVTVLFYLVGLRYGPVAVATSYSISCFLIQLPVAYYIAGKGSPVTTRDLWTRFLLHLPLWGVVFGTTVLLRTFVSSSSFSDAVIDLCAWRVIGRLGLHL